MDMDDDNDDYKYDDYADMDDDDGYFNDNDHDDAGGGHDLVFRLRVAMDDLLVKLSLTFTKRKDQIIFLINNYDVILSIFKVSAFFLVFFLRSSDVNRYKLRSRFPEFKKKQEQSFNNLLTLRRTKSCFSSF